VRAKTHDMYVLGLSALTHDSAAALIGENGVVAAIEEGKLERQRLVGGIPRAAIRFCMERAGIGWSELSTVAMGSRPLRAWIRRALLRARLTPLAPISSGYYQSKAIGELSRELNNLRILAEMQGTRPRGVVELDHHRCHAASAFYASSFDRALILTLDEQGDGQCGLVAIGEGSRIRAIRSIPFPQSLAWVYSQVTQVLGFRPRQDEHKTHWLSLAGEPVLAGVFLEMLRHRSTRYPRVDRSFFKRGLAGQVAFSAAFYRRLGIPSPPEPVPEALRATLAASVQQACTVVVGDLVESLRRQTGARFLCLAGGLFLNPLLVAALEKNTGFENIFVQPAAGNEGTALGAAWLVWHELLKKPRVQPMSHVYWGPSYSNEEIKQVLDNSKARYGWMESEERKIDEALKLLQAGKIVGWFQGAAEFGPRALGNRSLLASPWAPYVKENLNDYVKHRESFRPFALSVPEEDCERYFECSEAGRFLATMGRARPQARELLSGYLLPGDRVRLHVVTQGANPLFWRLLKRFGEHALAPLLVNTSFNLFGEPLVITPRDAVRSFFCSGADALVAGSFVLSKS
jgi:carbamoyltransferase